MALVPLGRLSTLALTPAGLFVDPATSRTLKPLPAAVANKPPIFTVKWAVDEAAKTGWGVGLGVGRGLPIGLGAGLCSRDRAARGGCVVQCVLSAWAVFAGATRFAAVGAAACEVAENVAEVTARPSATAPAAKIEERGIVYLKDLWGKEDKRTAQPGGSPLNLHRMA